MAILWAHIGAIGCIGLNRYVHTGCLPVAKLVRAHKICSSLKPHLRLVIASTKVVSIDVMCVDMCCMRVCMHVHGPTT